MLGNKESILEGIKQDEKCEELVKKCLEYFFERLSDGGAIEWPEVEYLEDSMCLWELGLIRVFEKLGYKKEE